MRCSIWCFRAWEYFFAVLRSDKHRKRGGINFNFLRIKEFTKTNYTNLYEKPQTKKVQKEEIKYIREKKPSLACFIISRVALLLFALALIILFIMSPNNYQPENNKSWQFLLRNWKWIAFVIFLILLVPIIICKAFKNWLEY